MKIYVVYDKLAKCPVRIMQFESDDVAVRFLKNAFDVPNSPFTMNCSDTHLIHIADIDSDSLNVIPSNCTSELSYNDINDDIVKYNITGRLVRSYDDLVDSYLKRGIYNASKEQEKILHK